MRKEKPLSKRARNRLKIILKRLDNDIFSTKVFQEEREAGLFDPPLE